VLRGVVKDQISTILTFHTYFPTSRTTKQVCDGATSDKRRKIWGLVPGLVTRRPTLVDCGLLRHYNLATETANPTDYGYLRKRDGRRSLDRPLIELERGPMSM
jgi:hypothetical protein